MLPDHLDRATVRAVVLAQPLTDEGMFNALLASYAWGWSVTHVGIGRASRVINAGPAHVSPGLLASRARVLETGPLAGYWALARDHKITGLGLAFATNFLYFWSSDNARAPIIDRLVAAWLAERTPITVTATRFVKRDYASYLGALANWTQELAIEPHQMEELISTDEARRRGLPGWAE